MLNKGKNNIFIISGPSGAGEDSIINGLKKYLNIERVITTTDRKMRKDESPGNPYYFISKKEFEDGIKNNLFFEYAKEYNDNFYGVTRKEIERVKNCAKIGIWKIEYKGVITAKKFMPKIVAIFINAPSLKVLEKRIRKRGKISEKSIKERIQYTKEWLKHSDIYDYSVVNYEGKLNQAINDVKKIILSVIARSDGL
ncbi:MAG: guanylate kinase [Xanthomonadaceae bacterium]|nr:guanylate kinase [Rhodospirillaceae bacterium]NIA18125.1 guanylate kinase [Xanthomonadaceae bacterium]